MYKKRRVRNRERGNRKGIKQEEKKQGKQEMCTKRLWGEREVGNIYKIGKYLPILGAKHLLKYLNFPRLFQLPLLGLPLHFNLPVHLR